MQSIATPDPQLSSLIKNELFIKVYHYVNWFYIFNGGIE